MRPGAARGAVAARGGGDGDAHERSESGERGGQPGREETRVRVRSASGDIRVGGVSRCRRTRAATRGRVAVDVTARLGISRGLLPIHTSGGAGSRDRGGRTGRARAERDATLGRDRRRSDDAEGSDGRSHLATRGVVAWERRDGGAIRRSQTTSGLKTRLAYVASARFAICTHNLHESDFRIRVSIACFLQSAAGSARNHSARKRVAVASESGTSPRHSQTRGGGVPDHRRRIALWCRRRRALGGSTAPRRTRRPARRRARRRGGTARRNSPTRFPGGRSPWGDVPRARGGRHRWGRASPRAAREPSARTRGVTICPCPRSSPCSSR